MDQDTWIAVVVVLLVVILGYGMYAGFSEAPAEPTSFAECVAAGGAIMESFPEQCAFNGRTFTNSNQEVPPVSGDDGQSVATGACRPTGCSGQICSDKDEVSTCEFQPQYACYQTATCERQPTGVCGWTPTAALTACLANPPQM